MSSRLQMTAKNAFWGYFSMGITLLLQFVSRTVFIYYLGEGYLGINGLFSNVLGVLSFAELGIGTAMNFSLYKPVAEHNIEKIKAYMNCYKWAYRAIAVVVTLLGMILVPFLDILVKDPGDVGNIKVYYFIYLFNTVTTYFVSYKYSLVNAEQKNYIYTNVNLLINLTTLMVQIISLIVWKNFLIYLLVAAGFGVFQKIFVSTYFNKLYPYLKEKSCEKLTKEETQTLISKIKALVIHKIGEVSVHQTDNIIISAFINTTTVGLMSNYNLLINTVNGCISMLFNSVTGSLGNMVATESKAHQYIVFKRYRFIGFWFYGFTSVVLAVLMTPFITLWIGEKMVIDSLVVNLVVLNYYMMGHRICLNNIKSAAGIYEQDKYLALVQALVNLGASIFFVKLIGLPGVFIGTILQGSLANILKPVLCYKTLFGISSKYYFFDSLKYGGAVLAAYAVCQAISNHLLSVVNIYNFGIMVLIVTIIPNIIFLLLFGRTDEFKYVFSLVSIAYNRFCKRG